jgi:hypothetical protein
MLEPTRITVISNVISSTPNIVNPRLAIYIFMLNIDF